MKSHLACNFELKQQIGFVEKKYLRQQKFDCKIWSQQLSHKNNGYEWPHLYGVVGGGLSQNKESAKLSYKWSIWVLKFWYE